jgi:hypothetical protein
MLISEHNNKNKKLLDFSGLDVAYPTHSSTKSMKITDNSNSKFRHEKLDCNLILKPKMDNCNSNISQIMKYQKLIARNRFINGIYKSPDKEESFENNQTKGLSFHLNQNNVLSRNLSDLSKNDFTSNKKILNFKSNLNINNNRLNQNLYKKELSYCKENSNSKFYHKNKLISHLNSNKKHPVMQSEEKLQHKIDSEYERKFKTNTNNLMKIGIIKNDISIPSTGSKNIEIKNSRLKALKINNIPILTKNHSFSKNNISQLNNSSYNNHTNIDHSIILDKTQSNIENSILSKITFKKFSPLTRNIKRDIKSPLTAISGKQPYNNNKTYENKILRKDIFESNLDKSILSSNSFLNNTELLERTANFSFMKDIKMEEKSFNLENENKCQLTTNMNLSELDNSVFNPEYLDGTCEESKLTIKEKDKSFTELSGYEHDYLYSEYISVNSFKTHESRVRETETIINNRQTQNGFTFREEEEKNTQNTQSNNNIYKPTSQVNIEVKLKSKNLIKNLNKNFTKSQSNSTFVNVSSYLNRKPSFGSTGGSNSRNIKSSNNSDKKLFLFNKIQNAYPLRPVKVNEQHGYLKNNCGLLQNKKLNDLNPLLSFKLTSENVEINEDSEKLNEKDTRQGSTIDSKIVSNYQTPKLSNTNSNRASLNDSIRRLTSGSPKIIKNHPSIKSFFEM